MNLLPVGAPQTYEEKIACLTKGSENTGEQSGYNNCFVVGGIKEENGQRKKMAAYVDEQGIGRPLAKNNPNYYQLKHLSYQEAIAALSIFTRKFGYEPPLGRVSLWLNDAKYNDLHIFVADFDKIDGHIDTDSPFFKAAIQLADKVTRSQGGGYHLFYGINKEKATPLFESINLLASSTAQSYICKTSNLTKDGRNKVDFFCDAFHFIYEWEKWDNSAGLTDKTQELYELIRDNFELKPVNAPKSSKQNRKSGKAGYPKIEKLSEKALIEKMSDKQREVFADLKTKSSDCPANTWYSIGIDICHVFGEELGGEVFRWWSSPGHSFNESGCATTWESICDGLENSVLVNSTWEKIMEPAPAPAIILDEEQERRIQAETEFYMGMGSGPQDPPSFRGLPITWVNKTTNYSDGKTRTEHFISWNGGEYKREDFFRAAYPEQYNQIRRRVKFHGKAYEDSLWLSGPQRTKLMYQILAAKYGLITVDENDNNDLMCFCAVEQENSTAAEELLSRLTWENGLNKLVTFGASMKLNEAAQHTWCYTVEYHPRKAIFCGQKITWEEWSMDIINALEKCGQKVMDMREIWENVRCVLYYQNKKRLTLTKEDYNTIRNRINDYVCGIAAPFPFSGLIPAPDYKFEIDFQNEKEVEFIKNQDLKRPEDMAAYNRENNAARGSDRIRQRFFQAFPAAKPGDTVTTAQLKEHGYNDNKAIKRLVDAGVVNRIKRGNYVVQETE